MQGSPSSVHVKLEQLDYPPFLSRRLIVIVLGLFLHTISACKATIFDFYIFIFFPLGGRFQG